MPATTRIPGRRYSCALGHELVNWIGLGGICWHCNSTSQERDAARQDVNGGWWKSR